MANTVDTGALMFGEDANENPEPIKSSAGSAHIANAGVAGVAQARNREHNVVSTTRQKGTWATGVTEVTVTVTQEAAGTAEFTASIAIAFGAPNDAVANGWLTAADSETADSNRYIVYINRPRTFYFSGAGITRADFLRVFGTEALTVILEAA